MQGERNARGKEGQGERNDEKIQNGGQRQFTHGHVTTFHHNMIPPTEFYTDISKTIRFMPDRIQAIVDVESKMNGWGGSILEVVMGRNGMSTLLSSGVFWGGRCS